MSPTRVTSQAVPRITTQAPRTFVAALRHIVASRCSLTPRSKAIFTISKTTLAVLCTVLLVEVSALAGEPVPMLLPADPTTARQRPILEPLADTITARQREWLDASVDERIRIAELLGEEGAMAYAKKKGYQPILTKANKTLPQGFDQVYRAKNGGIVVIEAKGGTSPLGHAYGHPQGTPSWAVETAHRMMKSSRASVAEKEAAKFVLEAASSGKLTVEVVRTSHIQGEPGVPVLESSLKAGNAEKKMASAILEKLAMTTKGVQAASKAEASAQAAGKAASGASKAASGARNLSHAAKAAASGAVIFDVVIRGKESVETEEKYRNGEISSGERTTRHAKNAAGMAGGWGGAWVGAKSGTAAGTAVGAFFGGVGAPVGAFIGGSVGAIGGYFGGEYLGERLIDGLKRFWE